MHILNPCRAVAGAVLIAAVSGAALAEPFTFVQMADPQFGFTAYQRDLRVFRQAITQIDALAPDFVLVCGDVVHATASEKGFQDYMESVRAASVPFHTAPGNHDVGAPAPDLLERYRAMIGPDRFAFDHKGFTFIVANSQFWLGGNPEDTARHDRWLVETLEEASRAGRPVIVAMHQPLYIESPDEEAAYFNLPREKRAELLDLFESNGVRAVLTGHAHRTIIHEHGPMRLVTSETTSINFDGRPLGYRVWHVAEDGTLTHEPVPVDLEPLATGVSLTGSVHGVADGETCFVLAVKAEPPGDGWSPAALHAMDSKVWGRGDLGTGGAFSIEHLQPGTYEVVAVAHITDGQGQTRIRFGSRPVELASTGLTGIDITLD